MAMSSLAYFEISHTSVSSYTFVRFDPQDEDFELGGGSDMSGGDGPFEVHTPSIKSTCVVRQVSRVSNVEFRFGD